MRRRTTASTLLVVALLASVSAGQPPAAPPDPTDALIQRALANDPDVQVARAKLALAEAEVTKARQGAVGRALAARDAVERQKAELQLSEANLARQELLRKQGLNDPETVLTAQAKVSAARHALTRVETEFRLLTGDGPKAAAEPKAATTFLHKLIQAEGAVASDEGRDKVLRVFAGLLDQARAVNGPIPDRIRAALDKKVRLGNKGDGIALDAAMEVFRKEAGLDVPIRPTPSPMPRIVLDGEELPIGAWFQMFQDHGGHRDGFAFYVRDYGLLVANRQTAPPDAMTLTAFWHTRPVEAKQPEPKQPPGKQHEFPHDKLPAALKAKAGESIFVTFPVKTADLEDAKVGSDTPAVVVRVASRDRMVLVEVQSERAGKARVTWDLTDATGRRFTERGREIEFE